MRIVKVEPGRVPYEKEIENNLKSIQAEVGVGLFQPLYLGAGIVLCCNEEGKLNGMPPNRRLGDDILAALFSWWEKTARGNRVPHRPADASWPRMPSPSRNNLPGKNRSWSPKSQFSLGKEEHNEEG